MRQVRAQPPARSPLSLGALAGGVWAAVMGEAAARAAVIGWLETEYAPRALLLTDSGTSALSLAIGLAARERQGPVALPAFCCYDIATAVDGARIPFVLYDVDPHTLAPDPVSLERVLSATGAGSVVVAHLYGVPVCLDPTSTLLQKHRAILIEDAAQAAGARIGSQSAGAVGRLGVLSFGRGKGMTAGQGGALLANVAGDEAALDALAGELRPARGGARTAAALLAQWAFARPAVYGLPASLPFLGLGETIYRRCHAPGAMSALSLGVLARTLPFTAAESATRRTNARRLLDALRDAPSFRSVTAPPGTDPGYLRLPVLVGDDVVIASRSTNARRLGIWPSYPLALADLPGFGDRRLNLGDAFPGARELARRLVTLPTHGYLGTQDIDALRSWIARPN
ncbi:MAG TPA: DegT/DnrJ/EryC1/StrS family aminotransferase [Gemmatimonadales bacterium]|nr:DegT/DnrJ/EryC1/StrS family aminotransferase [Gemmatimonadales bacterium]